MKKNPEYYILVSKALIRTWIASTIVLVIGILAAFQYANYVDRRSNRELCGLVILFDDANEKVPKQTAFDIQFVAEFERLRKKFSCK